jgi:seryl-tRNA synthetase
MTDRNRMDELISALQQQRDELALKIHLGKKEAQDEWEQVTDQFDKLKDDYKPVKDAVSESAGGVADALWNVGKEIQEGFQRIRKSL